MPGRGALGSFCMGNKIIEAWPNWLGRLPCVQGSYSKLGSRKLMWKHTQYSEQDNEDKDSGGGETRLAPVDLGYATQNRERGETASDLRFVRKTKTSMGTHITCCTAHYQAASLS